MTSSEIFKRCTFCGTRYFRLEDQKPWHARWHITIILPQEEILNPPKSVNVEILRRIEQSSATQTYHRLGSRGEHPSCWAIFCNFLGKLAILMALDHNSQVYRVI